jgi:Uma2 family endonuclease
MAVELRRARFTVDQYELMGQAGILDEDYRVELIGGEIVEMAAIGAPHASTVKRGRQLLGRRFPRAIIGVQDPLRLPDDDEPQPDLVVLRHREDFYRSSHPTGGDVLLLIEVADTTLRYDRNTKGPIYSRHGIADYWIVDLSHDALIVLRDPGPTDYRSEQLLRRGEKVSPLAFPRVEIAVEELLGPA